MNESTKQYIAALLADPDKLLQTTPYYRRIDSSRASYDIFGRTTESIGTKVRATLPSIKRVQVPIGALLREADPWSHSVLTDENIPSLYVKNSEGGYLKLEQKRLPLPYQQSIAKKQTLHLCNNQMSHVLLNTNPTETQSRQFIRIKQAWDELGEITGETATETIIHEIFSKSFFRLFYSSIICILFTPKDTKAS